MQNDVMEFPNTFNEFAKEYGFKDKEEIYTNGSELIPVFRVKQWLEYLEKKMHQQSLCNALNAYQLGFEHMNKLREPGQ